MNSGPKGLEVPQTRIEGELLGFTWQDDDSAFAVARIRTGAGEELTAVGPLAHLLPGQQVLLVGKWVEHRVHGRQLRVNSFMADDPRTLEGLATYLASGAIKGVGSELAARIVDHFGLDTLRVIAQQPHRLTEVSGIGPGLVKRIEEAYDADMEGRELLATLRGHGVGAAVARRILDRYGAGGLAVVARDPYRLAREVPGVGFQTADSIARQQGITRGHPARAEAVLLHVLHMAETEGHCFLPLAKVESRCAALDLDQQSVAGAQDRLAQQGLLHIRSAADPGQSPVQLCHMAQLEREVAVGLVRLAAMSPSIEVPAVSDAASIVGLSLDREQSAAVEMALRGGLVVITGGPGTGKTTLVRVLLAAARAMGQTWRLAAPTGRAARRLSESCGHDAVTVHRLLEFTYPEMRFKRDASMPLEADGILVDEASMLDLKLLSSLLAALPPRARLALVGDDHQLPSVGAGQVLHDLIQSGVVPVVRLGVIYRQGEGSGIVLNAHRVDQGEMPISAEREQKVAHAGGQGASGDFFIVERDDPLEAQATLLEVLTRRLPRRGFDPLRDVQVLVPMHRGDLGTIALNSLLQRSLNPEGPDMLYGQRRFREGDRVIQIRNNYATEVFNGEVGRVLHVAHQALVLDFDGRQVELVGKQVDEVDLAYAITVHKSQGSEYPAVVVMLHKSHKLMLRRNLLYTALSRARTFCCVIGSRWAMRMAVAVSGRGDRYSLLEDLLREESSRAMDSAGP